MIAWLQRKVAAARARLRERNELGWEILALRHQIAVLRRTGTRRPRFSVSHRLMWVLLSRWWSGWRSNLTIVQPETVLRRAENYGIVPLTSEGPNRAASLLRVTGRPLSARNLIKDETVHPSRRAAQVLRNDNWISPFSLDNGSAVVQRGTGVRPEVRCKEGERLRHR